MGEMNKPKETCGIGKQRDGYLRLVQEENSYIHEHLSTLYFLAKEGDCHRILEIGCGYSTAALSQALWEENSKNYLHSVDIDEVRISKVRDTVRPNVTFMKMDSLKFEPSKWLTY